MFKFITMLKSWHTTAVGVVGALGVIITQLYNLLDNDPLTVFDYNFLWVAGVLVIMGLFAKDATKSSEDVGLKP